MTTPMWRQIYERAAVAGFTTLNRVWNTPRTRWYRGRARHRALHGQYAMRAGGLAARFDVSLYQDFEFLDLHTEPEHLERFLGLLQPDDVVYEIGGHIGSWTVFLAQQAPRGTVCVFEPEPQTMGRLKANVALNRLGNVMALQMAASRAAGRARFGVCGGTDDQASLLVRGEHQNVIEVETIAVDQVPARCGAPPPTACKLDCEGAELDVLQGMPEILKSGRIRVMHVEIHTQFLAQAGHSGEEVVALLAAYGYQPIHQTPRGGQTMAVFARGG